MANKASVTHTTPSNTSTVNSNKKQSFQQSNHNNNHNNSYHSAQIHSQHHKSGQNHLFHNQSHNITSNNNQRTQSHTHPHGPHCSHAHSNLHNSFVYNKINPHVSYANKSKIDQDTNNFNINTSKFTFGPFQGFDSFPTNNNTSNTSHPTSSFNNNNNSFNNKNSHKNPNPTAAPTQHRSQPLSNNQKRRLRRKLVNNNLHNLNPNIREQNKWDKIPFYYDFATHSYYNKFDPQFDDKMLLNRMGRSMYVKDEKCPKIILFNINIDPSDTESSIISKLADFTNTMKQNNNHAWDQLTQADILQVQVHKASNPQKVPSVPPSPILQAQGDNDEKDQKLDTVDTTVTTAQHDDISMAPNPHPNQRTNLTQHPPNSPTVNNIPSDNDSHNYPTSLNPDRAQHIIHIPNHKSPYFYLPHTNFVDQNGNFIPKSKLPFGQEHCIIITINPHGQFMLHCYR